MKWIWLRQSGDERGMFINLEFVSRIEEFGIEDDDNRAQLFFADGTDVVVNESVYDIQERAPLYPDAPDYEPSTKTKRKNPARKRIAA